MARRTPAKVIPIRPPAPAADVVAPDVTLTRKEFENLVCYAGDLTQELLRKQRIRRARAAGAKKAQRKRSAKAAERNKETKTVEEAHAMVRRYGKSRAADLMGIGRSRLNRILLAK